MLLNLEEGWFSLQRKQTKAKVKSMLKHRSHTSEPASEETSFINTKYLLLEYLFLNHIFGLIHTQPTCWDTFRFFSVAMRKLMRP